MPSRNRSPRSRGGRLHGGAAAGLIAAGGVVVWFACQSPGPPKPDRHAARPRAAISPSAAATTPVLDGSIPVRVDIPRIGVHSRLVRLGIRRDGTVAVPPLRQAQLAGWYDKGPTPGERGPAVILGHVDTRKGPAVFYDLGRLHPGDIVDVTRKDGVVAKFTVDSVEQVPKKHFPADRVYGDLTYAGLRLITCGGHFNGHHYTANTIVYAHLSSSHPA